MKTDPSSIECIIRRLQMPRPVATTGGMNMPNTYPRLVIWLLASTLLVSAVFTSFPQIDIYVSSLFYSGGFWLHDHWLAQAVRHGLIYLMYAFAAGTLVAFLYARIRKKPAKSLGYGVAVIVAGPLLLVNAVLKNNWGRARPADITYFGGEKAFTPAYQFSYQCETNCSFTSGEGAGIATLAILVAFWAWPRLVRHQRILLSTALGGLVTVGAGLRVAVGRHFLSDTLLSILFCALVAVAIYGLFYRRNIKTYAVEYLVARARHKPLGYQIEVAVPVAAKHRPAVQSFLQGRYYEAFSHKSFAAILRHRPGNVVHAGTFFGDMLHTLSQNAETVYAFEPVLDNYILAKQNIARLNLKNVMLFNAGLGAEAGSASIQVRSEKGRFRGGTAKILNPEGADPLLFEQVPVFALDGLPIDNVSLLHLDVEGYERRVLQGAKHLIKRSSPIVLLEDNAKNCAAFLEKRGYRFCFFHGSLNYWAMPEDYDFVCGLKPA